MSLSALTFRAVHYLLRPYRPNMLISRMHQSRRQQVGVHLAEPHWRRLFQPESARHRSSHPPPIDVWRGFGRAFSFGR
jgi:hypothetical protein